MRKIDNSYILMWVKKIRAINLLGGKCSICEEKRFWVLSFHHIDPKEKEFNITSIRDYRWSLIEKEIKKCKLICRNCHKEIHHIEKMTKSQTNKLICMEFIGIKKCEICGYDKCNEALEFHHQMGVKKFIISNIINNAKFFKTPSDLSNKIKKELLKCSVICSNCHLDKHFDKEKFERYKSFINVYNYKEMPKKYDRQQVLQLYKKGLKQIDIAKILNCRKSTISYIMKKIIGQSALKVIGRKDFENKEEFKKRGRVAKTFEECVQLILNNIIRSEKNCWLWKGHCRKAYGTIYLRDREIAVHRIIYEKFKGAIPKGLYVGHACNENLCCNPEHLSLITPAESGQLNIKNGKIHRTDGEKSGMHKLTTEQVIKIREDSRKLLDIAKEYGVAKSTVSMIKNGKSRING